MGYFLKHKIPDYNPLWEEPEFKDEPDYKKWFNLGYEDGYAAGYDNGDELKKLEQENESLRSLISANFRVEKALKT